MPHKIRTLQKIYISCWCYYRLTRNIQLNFSVPPLAYSIHFKGGGGLTPHAEQTRESRETSWLIMISSHNHAIWLSILRCSRKPNNGSHVTGFSCSPIKSSFGLVKIQLASLSQTVARAQVCVHTLHCSSLHERVPGSKLCPLMRAADAFT